jgi:hypothetical protein
MSQSTGSNKPLVSKVTSAWENELLHMCIAHSGPIFSSFSLCKRTCIVAPENHCVQIPLF